MELTLPVFFPPQFGDARTFDDPAPACGGQAQPCYAITVFSKDGTETKSQHNYTEVYYLLLKRKLRRTGNYPEVLYFLLKRRLRDLAEK
ncbi:MAG: hypothetical protein U0586_16890 [Candidatus Brocadiaceae bacterium]